MEPAEVVDRKGSTGVVLTVFKHCVNTGDKDWLWLQFSFIHYIALDLQREPRTSENLSSGFEFGDLGCWVWLGISSKVCFINMLSLWFPLSFTSTFPSKLPFLQWFPNPTSLWCVGRSSQDLAAEPPHVPRRWCQSHLSFRRRRYCPQIYQDPWREPVAEESWKKSVPRKDQISPSRKSDLQEMWYVNHQQHVVSCTIHMPTLQEFSRSISSFQEVFQFLSHIEVDALSPKHLLFSFSGHGLAAHGPKILRFHSWLEGLWKPGVSPVCFWFLFPSAGSFFILLSIPWHLSLPSPVAPHQNQLHPSLSVPVRKQRGNYVPASTFLSSHSMFP